MSMNSNDLLSGERSRGNLDGKAARGLLVATLLLLFTGSASAAELVAGRAPTPPAIDGTLEKLWSSAPRIDRFIQIEPAMGAEATVPTEVFLLYDDQNLYVAARLVQARDTVRGSVGRRDDPGVWDGDYFLIAVDPFSNGNSAFFFVVNPASGLIDGILDSSENWSREWDGRVRWATRMDDDGWVVEIAIALDSIGFQADSAQTWGILVGRHFAERRERALDAIGDRNAPFRIDTFPRVGFEFEKTARPMSISTYLLALGESRPDSTRREQLKSGLDLRWVPRPSLTLLGTVKPDFAQLESDVEVINVSDVPWDYPEKRPFFTESSDLYPGLAVNTRNIGEIVAGAKLHGVLPLVRYDVTAVLDGDDNDWLLGNVRWTDNRRYHVEVISGLKHSSSRDDYNVTTNLRTWWLDKRLTAYTWFGTINGPNGGANEWESVNAVKWTTRTFRAGLWNHFKSELYNPNVVGYNTLSNEVILQGWLEWSRFNDEGVLRQLDWSVGFERYDLYSDRGNDYHRFTATVGGKFVAPGRLGLWSGEIDFLPAAHELFRYRNPAAAPGLAVHRDAFGEFVLVGQHRDGGVVSFSSDPSRPLSITATWKTSPLRGAAYDELETEVLFKVGSRSLISGSLGRIVVGESRYQTAYTQTLERVKIEHTFANDLNVRAIFQNNTLRSDGTSSKPVVNLLVSWPMTATTTVHLLADQSSVPDVVPGKLVTRSMALKVSHTFRAR